jgi:hypothetical protein
MHRILHRSLPAVLLTVALLGVGACGSNDDAKASKSISDSLMKSSSSSTSKLLSMKRKDADCIGDGLVAKVGTDKLKKYGLLTKDLKSKDSISDTKMSAGDAKVATGVLFGCTDVEAMMESAIDKSSSVPKQMKACVDKALTKSTLRPVFEEIFQGKQDQATKSLTEPLTKCATG